MVLRLLEDRDVVWPSDSKKLKLHKTGAAQEEHANQREYAGYRVIVGQDQSSNYEQEGVEGLNAYGFVDCSIG
jgi:hypothetical protein